MTDKELKRAVAQMSNGTLYIDAADNLRVGGSFVAEEEMLHVCHIIESSLTDAQYEIFGKAVMEEAIEGGSKVEIEEGRRFLSAPWQRRARGLIKAKGLGVQSGQG